MELALQCISLKENFMKDAANFSKMKEQLSNMKQKLAEMEYFTTDNPTTTTCYTLNGLTGQISTNTDTELGKD